MCGKNNFFSSIFFFSALFTSNVHYIERDGTEYYYTMDNTPPNLEKKVKLLSYFRRYMKEHLMKAGASVLIQESDQLSRTPYLHQWNRSASTVIMQLTNGTLQVCTVQCQTYYYRRDLGIRVAKKKKKRAVFLRFADLSLILSCKK